MLKVYTFRSDHGGGNFEISLALDTDYMPICFDTFMDWVEAQIEPKYRHMAWKLINENIVHNHAIEREDRETL